MPQTSDLPHDQYPIWYDGKRINEILFCDEFLKEHPMRYINGKLFTLDGPVESEELIRKQIAEMMQCCVTSNISKRATMLLECLKLRTYSQPFPLKTDRIHVSNGICSPDGRFAPKMAFCNNRLPGDFNPDAPTPVRWLSFLRELLDESDIPCL